MSSLSRKPFASSTQHTSSRLRVTCRPAHTRGQFWLCPVLPGRPSRQVTWVSRTPAPASRGCRRGGLLLPKRTKPVRPAATEGRHQGSPAALPSDRRAGGLMAESCRIERRLISMTKSGPKRASLVLGYRRQPSSKTGSTGEHGSLRCPALDSGRCGVLL